MNDLSWFDLTNRKALATGAAGGIGKASALAMAMAGGDTVWSPEDRKTQGPLFLVIPYGSSRRACL